MSQRPVHIVLSGYDDSIQHRANVMVNRLLFDDPERYPFYALAAPESDKLRDQLGIHGIQLPEAASYMDGAYQELLFLSAMPGESIFFLDANCYGLEPLRHLIDEWACSEKQDYLIIRDHPVHAQAITPGMWGVHDIDRSVLEYVKSYPLRHVPNTLGLFLSIYVYPRSLDNGLLYDTVYKKTHESSLPLVRYTDNFMENMRSQPHRIMPWFTE